jgi:hypothetical protein
MTTLPARNPILRQNLFAVGFKASGETRVSPPAGMGRKAAKSLFSKVFLRCMILGPERECYCGCNHGMNVVGFVPG